MNLEEDVPLAPLTTLRVGGPARFYTRAETHAELLEALRFARSESIPTFLLGGGSNLLVSDEGFPGLVLHMALRQETKVEGNLYDVAAGTDWDSFVMDTCKQGVSGIECLAGIPGLTGGTPIQNVGAYGQEVSQTIDRVTAVDLQTLATASIDHAACAFAYRQSIFNTTARSRYIVTSVRFRLNPDMLPDLTYADLKQHFTDQQPTPLEVYHAVRQIRASKGMLVVKGDPNSRSAGSFFKNPIVAVALLPSIAEAAGEASVPNWPTGPGTTKLPAAWLLEKAGFTKGFCLGPAGISSRHTLALINRTGDAKCADIIHLRDTIVREVNSRFEIKLEQEPVELGPVA